MRIILFFLTIILLTSCYTQRAALRDLNKIKVHHPDLIEEVPDTIIQVLEVTKEVPIKGDTLEADWEWDWSKVDTFYQTISDSTVITEVQLIRDTVVNISVRTEVFPDTIEVLIRDTIETIVIKNRIHYQDRKVNSLDFKNPNRFTRTFSFTLSHFPFA